MLCGIALRGRAGRAAGVAMSREALAPERLPLRPKRRLTTKRRYRKDRVPPCAAGPPYLDDWPCVPGKRPLWPGGPALPRWAEREMEKD